jgi:hypothetical protein
MRCKIKPTMPTDLELGKSYYTVHVAGLFAKFAEPDPEPEHEFLPGAGTATVFLLGTATISLHGNNATPRKLFLRLF